MRETTSTGRMPASRAPSLALAVRLPARTETKVAAASTRVAPAVASEAMVDQSAAMSGRQLPLPWRGEAGGDAPVAKPLAQPGRLAVYRRLDLAADVLQQPQHHL